MVGDFNCTIQELKPYDKVNLKILNKNFNCTIQELKLRFLLFH